MALQVLEDSKSLSKLLSDAVGAPNSTPQSLIGLMQREVVTRLGGIPKFKSADEEAVFFANVNHATSMSLSRLTDKSYQAHRLHIYHMFQSGEWQNVRLPMVDPVSGEPMRDADGSPSAYRFSDFDDYFEYLSATAHLDVTIASVTYNCVTRLLPAVATGEIDAEWEEVQGDLKRTVVKLVTVDDVCSIERSKLETIMSPVRKHLTDHANDGDDEHLRMVGTIVQKALTLSRKELKRWLAGSGNAGTQVMTIDTHVAEIGDGKAVMTLILDAAQRRYIDGIIGARLNEFPETMDQLMTTLAQLVERPIEHEELNEDDLLAELS